MAACVVPSYIIHNVFSYFDIHYQLRTLALVCKAWHHAALCMNCISTNITVQDAKQWFAQYFDIEIVDVLVNDFKSIIGAPHSYVVRNLVLQQLRDIQEAVPNIEIEIFMLYSQLANAHNKSEKLLKVYQVSALLYLLKKLESMFNIYEIFNNVPLALGNIQLPICRRDCLKMLLQITSMMCFRFDRNSPHINDNDFHVRAAIKCFDVKLLIRKHSPWHPIFELLEATIGPKFLRPDTVFQNFEQKLVGICKNDFTDFHELLSMLESDLDVGSDESDDGEPSETNVPRTGITKFPPITNEFLAQYIALQPSNYCDRNHALATTQAPASPCASPALPREGVDSDDAQRDREAQAQVRAGDTPSKYTVNNNNYDSTPNKNNSDININNSNNNNSPNNNNTNTITSPNNNNIPQNDNTSDNNHTKNDTNKENIENKEKNENIDKIEKIENKYDAHREEQSTESDTKNQNDKGKDKDKYSNKNPHKYGDEQSTLLITANPQPETTIINHAETKTNNDESTASAQQPNKESESSSTSCKRPVEDYKYFFDSEGEDESTDDEDYGEFEDDEKENEPPAKFIKTGAKTPDKCNVRKS